MLAIFGALSWLSVQLLHVDVPALMAQFKASGTPFRGTYTGIGAIDDTLTLIVQVFYYGVCGTGPAQRLQLLYFLPMLAAPILVWNVEANRRGHLATFQGKLLAW